MRAIFSAALALCLIAPIPASAQSTPEIRLPEKLDRALRDMMDAMKPTIDDAFDAMKDFQVIDDPRHYEMPEVLPNGDIIIRRNPDAPKFTPPGEEQKEDAAPTPDNSVKT